MKRLLLIAVLAASLTSCSNEDKSKQILEQAGYKNIELTGYACFGCGEEDMYHTGFIATAPNGDKVEGVVCGGILKGYTIRMK